MYVCPRATSPKCDFSISESNQIGIKFPYEQLPCLLREFGGVVESRKLRVNVERKGYCGGKGSGCALVEVEMNREIIEIEAQSKFCEYLFQ